MLLRAFLALALAVGMVSAVSAQKSDPMPKCYPCK
jgi:hypothetical protein